MPNPVAPPGGFVEGGWYEGRRYLGGQFLAPGEHQPGQLVSPEVMAQTDPANVAYIEKQRQQAGIVPTPTPSGVSGAGIPTAGLGITAPATINLPEMYKGLYESMGISKLEEEYSQKEKEFIEAKAKIDDNPYLSEATRVGRQAKIEKLFAERTANLQRDIVTKKADIEMQLNLQTQQFNIESQVAQQALSQFNSLLGMGALDNATGETIASLTRSTGLSSDMIQAAVEKSKRGELSVQSYDDGTNQYFVTVDAKGNIVNRQLVGPSGGGRGTQTERYQAEVEQSAIADARAGINVEGFAKKYGGSLEDWELINIYNQYTPYDPMKESPQQFKEWTGSAKAEKAGLDQEAIDAYVFMINAGTITLANVPKEYKSEVGKKIGQTTEEETPGLFERAKQVLGR